MKAPPVTVLASHEETAAGGSGIAMSFEGFDPPESNFWRLPNNWFDIVVCFTSWAEHKVVEYILRHTWGYHEYDLCKQITMDEFMHGRKRRDGSRMDAGCGMAENSIKNGIADAVAHGFLVVEVDDSDHGRIKKFYGPRMRSPQRDEGTPAVRPMTFPSAQEDSSDTHDLETADHGADARPGPATHSTAPSSIAAPMQYARNAAAAPASVRPRAPCAATSPEARRLSHQVHRGHVPGLAAWSLGSVARPADFAGRSRGRLSLCAACNTAPDR
jgi:hypothetical protein